MLDPTLPARVEAMVREAAEEATKATGVTLEEFATRFYQQRKMPVINPTLLEIAKENHDWDEERVMSPRWDDARRFLDWEAYVDQRLEKAWECLSPDVRVTIYLWASEYREQDDPPL